MEEKKYKPCEVHGLIRVGDVIITNLDGGVQPEGKYHTSIVRDTKTSSVYITIREYCGAEDTAAGWTNTQTHGITVSPLDDQPGAFITFKSLDIFGPVRQDQLDEILRLRKIEKEVKSLLG